MSFLVRGMHGILNSSITSKKAFRLLVMKEESL